MVVNPSGKKINPAGNFSVGSPVVQVVDHTNNLKVGITAGNFRFGNFAGQIVDPGSNFRVANPASKMVKEISKK